MSRQRWFLAGAILFALGIGALRAADNFNMPIAGGTVATIATSETGGVHTLRSLASSGPSSAAGVGITPIVSASAENNHVLKASAGNLYSVYATNLTATAGFLVVLNSITSPGDGAITPLECVPLPGSSNASINYGVGPPAVFSTGITAVITSAATCFTKTTGVITGYIKGAIQ